MNCNTYLKLCIATIVLFVAAPSWGQFDLNNGLVAYFPFNGNAMDESTNANHPLFVNTPELTTDCDGNPDGAYSFNGDGDFIEIKSQDYLDFNSNEPFAISLWIKAPVQQLDLSGTVNDILSKWKTANTASPYAYIIRITNGTSSLPGQIAVQRYDGSCGNLSKIESSSTVNDDTWHNVIFQGDDNGVLSLFIDGNLEGTGADESTCDLRSDQNILLGVRSSSSGSNRPFRGDIDELRIYNRVLTNDEIQGINNKLVSNELISSDIEYFIYPNPIVGSEFNVKNYDGKIEYVKVYGAHGMIAHSSNNQLPSALPTGVYWIEVFLENNTSFVEKVLIK